MRLKLRRNPRALLGMALATAALVITSVFVYRAEPQSFAGSGAAVVIPTDGPYHYKVEYLGITCGHMTLESRLEEYDGRPAYHIVMTASNSKFFNKIYRVDGRIDSWVDAEAMSTIAYESDITEKGRRKIRRYRIDYENGVVRAEKYGEVSTFQLDGEAALDPLAYVYRGRVLAGKPGSAFELNLLTDRGVVATESQVGEAKRFDTADGKIELLKIHPNTTDGEMFSRKGDFIYWIDPDPTKTLYRLDFKLSFGRLLAKYTGPAEGTADRRTEAEKAGPVPPSTELEEPEPPGL